MLNLDYGLRVTIRSGALAGCFLAAFLIVSQLAEGFADRFVGSRGWVVGAVAAGVLLLAVQPLQRWSDRLAGRIMPEAKPVSSMTVADRLRAYQDQVVVAWEDGALSRKERRMLEVARRRLGVGDAEARRIELRIIGR